VFAAFGDQFLAPHLRPGQTVILDNLSAHTSAAARCPDDLMAATNAALDAITAQDAAGCYADCGYPLRSHDE
jgi:hypothetical protein